MKVPEATNRLLHEIKKALSYWDDRFDSFEPAFLNELDREQTIAKNIIDADDEVREAIYNLVKSIRDEEKSST